MSKWTHRDSTRGRPAKLFDVRVLVRRHDRAPHRGRRCLATIASHLDWLHSRVSPLSTRAVGGDPAEARGSTPGECSRSRDLIRAYGYVVLIGLMFALIVVLLVLHPHIDLLESAFGGAPKQSALKGSTAGDTENLASSVSQLTKDASYVLVPSVSLAGAVGATFWALGSRRGPTIVGGAVVAGVVGVGLDVVVR